MKDDPFTRRRLLASAGLGGAVFVGAKTTAVVRERNEYAQKTSAHTVEDGPRLRIEWTTEYNGRVLNDEPTDGDPSLAEARGPILDHSNVLPGDEGRVELSLRADGSDVKPWLRVRLVSGDEGGLADAVSATMWYDTGIFGIGGCSGRIDAPGNRLLASGSLADVFETLGDGVELRPTTLGGTCLDERRRLCLGFAWELPLGVSNALQGESVSFAFDFGVTDCDDSTDPFARDGDPHTPNGGSDGSSPTPDRGERAYA